MSDLRTLLHETVPVDGTPAPSLLVEGDLARGRTALRRHRGRRGVRTGLVAVAAAGAITFAAQGGLPGGAATTATRATPPAATSAPEPPTSLVAYTGAQPDGFTVDTVPAGWTVQDSGEDQLLLAPDGGTDTDTTSFADKIVVSLQGEATGVQPTDVSVGGTTVGIYTMVESDAKGGYVPGRSKTLYVEQPSGGYLAAQIWDASSWSDQQIAEFGAGLHVTGEPATTVG